MNQITGAAAALMIVLACATTCEDGMAEPNVKHEITDICNPWDTKPMDKCYDMLVPVRRNGQWCMERRWWCVMPVPLQQRK